MNRSPIALVSTRLDPISERQTRSPNDVAAALLALQADQAARLITASEMPDSVARDYLALGAAMLTRLRGIDNDDYNEGQELIDVLAEHLESTDLIITGARTERGLASGLLPFMLAHRMRRPIINQVIALKPVGSSDNAKSANSTGWLVERVLGGGARQRLHLTVPVVLIAQQAQGPQRHAWQSGLDGVIQNIDVKRINTSPELTKQLAWRTEPRRRYLRRLHATTALSAHERMTRSVESERSDGSGRILQSGTETEMAQELLDHLQAKALIPGPGRRH